MELNEVHFDCLHFKGGIPCKPNKENGKVCSNCDVYRPIEKRILIIKLGALGDVIRSTPLLEKYTKIYPNAHFTWVTWSPAILPNEVHVKYKLDAVSIFNISNASFDIAINLDKEEEACKLLALVDSKEKFGFTWKNGHIAAATPAANHKLMTGFFDALSQENTKSYLEEIFEICHLKFEFENYSIPLNQELSNQWNNDIQQLAQGKKIVGLNTGCGPRWNTRLWSNESWMDLAKKLAGAGYFPVFLGGELEHEKNTFFSKETGFYYPGHFSLEEFIALTNSCEFVVTQVSMMMHIATALQKKLILMNTIFNAHEFELYGRGEIVGPPEPCICFYGNTCKKGKSCMNDIHPTAIFEAIERSK